MPKRKYEVCGTDDLGDVHIFLTDDRRRAEEVADVMGEDLEDVELSESDHQRGSLPTRDIVPWT